MRRWLIASLALALARPAYAEMVKSQYTAPNGIVVDVATDEFAGRREYSSPLTTISSGDSHGKVFASEVFNNGKLLGLTIQGSIFYSGDWRFYSSAIFKGGEAADYHRIDGDVSGCYQWGCSMSESFIIEITRDQARSHADGGEVALQLRSDHGQTALIQVPLAYLDAVAAVAGEPAQSAPPTPATISAPEQPAPVAAAPVTAKPTPKKAQPARKNSGITCVTCEPQ